MKRIFLNLIALMLVLGASAQTWNYVSSTGTTFILYGMSFAPGQSQIGYACGMEYTYDADGVIVKTTDGGDNWTQIWPASGTIDGLQGIWFIDENTGYAGGWNNYFIKTTDGGTTWTPVACASDVWYYTDIEFWDSNNGVASAYMNSGSDACIFVTDDGGSSWTPATSGVSGAMMAVCYADATTLFAVHTDAKVYKSTDGGHNWTVVQTLPAMLFGCDFADANFGVVGGEEKIFATNDGGNTWTTYTTGYENFYACQAFSDGTAYVGGTDERIHMTTDFGATWTLNNSGGASHLYRIRYTPNGAMTACGSQGTIIQAAPVLTASFIADNTEVCEGDMVNFTDNSIGTVVSWDWTFEGGTPSTSTDPDPTVTYNTAGTYDVTLEVSDGSNTNIHTEVDYIFVESIPVQATTPAGPDETCTGNTYEYTTDPIANADEYFWVTTPSDAGTFSGTGTTATFTADGSWTGAFTVKVRAVNECGDGDYSPELTVTQYASPDMFFMAGGGSYCNGGNGVEVLLDGSETGIDYELFLDGASTGTILPGTGDTLNFGFHTMPGLYEVTAYTPNCTTDMGGQALVSIIFMPGIPGTPYGPESVCNHESTDYTTTGSLNATSLTWILDPAEAGELVPGTDMVTVNWDAGFTGTAYLSLYGTNECGDGDLSDKLTITVMDSPTPEISGLTIVCEDDIEEYSTQDNPGNTYAWQVDGGTITAGAGTHQITVQWGSYGTGWVMVTEDNGACIDSTDHYMVQIDECTSIDELEDHEVRIYPNPASTSLMIEFEELNENEGFELQIRNMQGHLIESVIVTAGKDHTELNVESYPSGIYYIQVLAGERQYKRARFVVTH